MNKLFLLVISAIFFFGCSKSNVVPSSSAPTLTGLWYYTADTVNVYRNGVLSQTASETFNLTASLLFNNDGSGVQYDPGYVLFRFDYTLLGTGITLNFPAQSTGNLSLPDASTEKGTIKKLTDGELVLFFDETFNDNGVTVRETEASYLTK